MKILELRGLLNFSGTLKSSPDLCFNPGLVSHNGETILFYRSQAKNTFFTNIAVARLDAHWRPTGAVVQLEIPGITRDISSFEDPRAFVWRGDIYVMHNQSSFIEGSWSTSVVIGRYEDGKLTDLSVPRYGKNINRASLETASPAFEKNWTPLVIGDDLFLVYEINPMTVLKYVPETGSWDLHHGPAARQDLFWSGYISGSTPLIPWQGSEYIGLFHTYRKSVDRRLYEMGFFTFDVAAWRVTGISAKPVLSGWKNRWKDSRYGRRRLFKYDPAFEVVFPAGIIDQGNAWAVSFGWNDSRCYIGLFGKQEIAAQMKPVMA